MHLLAPNKNHLIKLLFEPKLIYLACLAVALEGLEEQLFLTIETKSSQQKISCSDFIQCQLKISYPVSCVSFHSNGSAVMYFFR